MSELYTRIQINGANTDEELKWAEKIGVKAYRNYVRIANGFIVPVYNWIWERLYPNTKDWIAEHPNYDKVYMKISNGLTNFIVFTKGGYDFKNKKKVFVNTLFNMLPTDEENTYIIKDMIFIKRM